MITALWNLREACCGQSTQNGMEQIVETGAGLNRAESRKQEGETISTPGATEKQVFE